MPPIISINSARVLGCAMAIPAIFPMDFARARHYRIVKPKLGRDSL